MSKKFWEMEGRRSWSHYFSLLYFNYLTGKTVMEWVEHNVETQFHNYCQISLDFLYDSEYINLPSAIMMPGMFFIITDEVGQEFHFMIVAVNKDYIVCERLK